MIIKIIRNGETVITLQLSGKVQVKVEEEEESTESMTEENLVKTVQQDSIVESGKRVESGGGDLLDTDLFSEPENNGEEKEGDSEESNGEELKDDILSEFFKETGEEAEKLKKIVEAKKEDSSEKAREEGDSKVRDLFNQLMDLEG